MGRMPPLARHRVPWRAVYLLALLVLVLAAATVPASAGTAASAATVAKSDRELLSKLAVDGKATFLVSMAERADLSAVSALRSKAAKGAAVYQRLTATADRSQAGLRAFLRARGVAFTPFWVANVIKVTGDVSLLNEIAARPDVARVELDSVTPVPKPIAASPGGNGINAIEWGVNNIRAPSVWTTFGVRGEGIVIANIDTGVQFNHPAVVGKYRGNLGGGTFDHNYNFFDPGNVCAGVTPCDNNGHGTHTMGTMVGDDGGANQIGVAPGARWIAAKGCASNSCSDSHLLASGQWVVAPTDNNNANPRPAMAPDIVNNSWGGGRGDTWYQATINSWISAGIFPSFSQGNSGPGCSTANDPGDYPNAYGVGAYDINNNIASFSSRGPSPFAGEIKPNIAAPGVNVRSSVPTNSYANFSGTSMAAPHLSGAVALIWSAAPALNGNINGTRTILDNTAIDVNSLGCGGTLDDNNNFGEGRLDAFAAVTAARGGGGGNPPVTVFTDDFETNRGWTTNAGGTDTATTGQWVRGDPAATNSSGPKQLGTTTSGVNDLVTGAAAGVGAGDFDVDGGITTIRSPAITLPSTGTLTLSLNWYLAHGSNATSADFLRVRVVGSTSTIVLNQAGAAVDRDGAWVAASANISSFAGQSVRLVVEAADAATASLVEAGVDDVRITQQT